VENPNSEADAVELMASVIETSDQKVKIVTLGPLTNIAELLRREPQVSGLIEGIYTMGGAVDVAGNVLYDVPQNKNAEWNIYIDPLAASEVFASGVPMTLVPLDATNLVPLDIEFYTQLENDHPEPEASFVLDALTRGEMLLIQSGSYYFWDPLAVAVMVNPSFVTTEVKNICVETEEGETNGATQIGADCPMVRMVVSVRADLFKTDFIETLNAPME
jgi:pyrimidine-specific ribonucleoside hydrolase